MSKLILCPDANASPDIRLSDNGSCNEMIWENGVIINAKEYDLSRLEFICEKLPFGKMTDYAITDMGCSIVSKRFKEFLENQGVDNIDYYSATVIECEGGQAKEGYYSANIIGLVDCIDRDSSVMRADYDDEGNLDIIFGISKLVLKDRVINCGAIFRAYPFTRLVLIDESLKEKFEKSPITGVRLIAPERWDGINGEIT